MIRVLLYGVLAELAGEPEVFVAGTRVLDALVALSSRYGPAFRDIVLGGGGSVRTIILVNKAPVRYNILEAVLREGDVLSLMPMDDVGDE